MFARDRGYCQCSMPFGRHTETDHCSLCSGVDSVETGMFIDEWVDMHEPGCRIEEYSHW